MIITLDQVCKTYPNTHDRAVDDVSLKIRKGQIVTLLGPSGCGKTTTLRLIAGFERPDQGKIILGEQTVVNDYTWIPPEKRGIGMVFQDYALFPHLSVEKNVAFGLKLDNYWRMRVNETLEMVDLLAFRNKLPSELSGGQQQRVALARALVREPVVVLLDEPFSNLDTDLRLQMRQEVVEILRKAEATAIFVTHDQKEALAISDEVVVMRQGKIEQKGTPKEIYQFPDTAFVASFVGQSNLLKGKMGQDGTTIETQLGSIPCNHTHGAKPGESVTISIRPDSFEMDPQGLVQGHVHKITYTGESYDAIIGAEVGKIRYDLLVHIHPEQEVAVGDRINFRILPHFVAVIRDK